MQPITRSCSRCGSEFVIEHARHKRQVFCSVTCSARSRPKSDPVARFWAKVERAGVDDCWPWKAAAGDNGYGEFYFEGRLDRSHRVAWKLANGPIPAGLCVLHRCDNPPCCNSKHLFLGTIADNNADKVQKFRHGRKKLEREHVVAILADTRVHRLIAADFGVSRTMVSNIKRGASFREFSL